MAQAVGTLTIPLVIYLVTRRYYEAQVLASTMSTINAFNSLALNNSDVLAVLHPLVVGEAATDVTAARQVWALYSLLNNRQLHYFLHRTRHSSKQFLAADAQIIANLLKHPRTKEILESGGYDPDFVAYVRSFERSAHAS